MPVSDYQPQLASLADAPPHGDQWLHEIKYDGYRIGCRIRDGEVTLVSRNGHDWTENFPAIADAARRLRIHDALLDGEVTVVLPDGRTSFQALQQTLAARGLGSRRTRGRTSGLPAEAAATTGSLVYFVFDLLHIEGKPLDTMSLEHRKSRLASLLGRPTPSSRIRYAAHVIGNGEAFFREAQRLGLEGVVSKRRDLPYRPGRRGGWVKTKCIQRQEFVVGGFTDTAGTRAGLGALLIGCYEDGRLLFCGRVGTGFTQKIALDIRARLDRLEQRTSPFTPAPAGALGRTAHWVKSTLVAAVTFTEWTSEGRIRHPSFQGLRADTHAVDVKRENAPARRAPSVRRPTA